VALFHYEDASMPAADSGHKRFWCTPYWSVMIPTYNLRANYLEETLLSVLQQERGSEQMQIEVIDDCSTDSAASEARGELGRGGWRSTPNLKIEVWQILRVNALSRLVEISCISCIRTIMYCWVLTIFYTKEPRRATLARSWHSVYTSLRYIYE
jgi:cellulose synthase/poly-beta-1,6-N-acetylglucosamine synthase-like glycosyltransferase